MTAVDTHATEADHGHAHGEHEHPPISLYVKVFVVLVVLTAIEVALSYASMSEHLRVVALLGFAVLKFYTVVAYFMHLKFDHWAFRALFAIGLVLAGGCYFVYLSTLHVWIPH
jgi:cytochrome c oxidase subunit 4